MYKSEKDHPIMIPNYLYDNKDYVPIGEDVQFVIRHGPWNCPPITASSIIYWLLMAGF